MKDHDRKLEEYIDYTVNDRNGTKVGTVECLWSDHTGQPAFLGVKTGWILGKTHVVPAHHAEANEAAETIRLPYDEATIKEAPAYPGGSELNEATEREVRTHYNIPWDDDTRRARGETRGQEETSVRLSAEEVKVGKRQVEYGGVRLRKIVRTETVTQPVELQREEIVIERVPAGQARAGDKAFSQEEIYIPLRREEPVVQKEARVTEEVRARKKRETERRTVSEQVRKEELQVEGAGRGSRRATEAQSRQQRESEQRRGRKAVFGIVKTQDQAVRIVDQLKSSRFLRDDISVLFSDKRTSKEFAHEKQTKAPEGAATGAAAGGAIGAGLGWLAGIGGLAIPGVGPLIAAGPIMAALSGGAVGAATGGLAGGLIGLGIPEYEAKRYQDRLKEGNILVSVHADNREEIDRAKEIFEQNGAGDIASAREEAVQR